MTKAMLDWLEEVTTTQVDIDYVRPALALAEALLAMNDHLAPLRRRRILAWLLRSLVEVESQSLREMASEIAWALARIAILCPPVGLALLDDTVGLARLEHHLRVIEGDAKFGAGKAALWLAAAISAETRSEVAAAVAAPAAGGSLANALAKANGSLGEMAQAALPFRRYMASRLAHPRSVVDLPFRDEAFVIAFLDLSYSCRATLALARLARAAAAHGRGLLGAAQAAELVAQADAAAAVAAAELAAQNNNKPAARA